jgi:hypothetical protein
MGHRVHLEHDAPPFVPGKVKGALRRRRVAASASSAWSRAQNGREAEIVDVIVPPIPTLQRLSGAPEAFLAEHKPTLE